MKKQGYFEQMWKGIVRPPRLHYQVSDLGKEVWVLENCVVRRYDFKVQNARGHDLVGSYFEPMRVFDRPHQCVIYLHGNSSSRLESMGILEYLIPYDIAVCGFDFSGCGISEGQYVSLGYFEKNDVQAIYDWLRNNKVTNNPNLKPMITSIGLWGRSMGSVTAILSTKLIPHIKVIVCDSPFSNLRLLCQKLAKSTYKVPACIFSCAFCFIRRKIMSEAQFDVDSLNIAEEIKSVDDQVSILFLSAKQDQLIDPSNPTLLYNLFSGYKRILYFEGNHNSRRPREIQQLITKFFIERMDRQDRPTSRQSIQHRVPMPKIQMTQVQPKSSTPQNEESDPIIKEIKFDRHTFVENIQTPQPNP